MEEVDGNESLQEPGSQTQGSLELGMPESSDAILETQASSSLHTKTPSRKLLPRLSPGFCCRESLSAVWGARPPGLPGLARSSGAGYGYLDHHLHPSLRHRRQRGTRALRVASPGDARVSLVRATAPLKGPARPAQPLTPRWGPGAPRPRSPRCGFLEEPGTGEGHPRNGWAPGAPGG